jgi:hypothetical protein
MTMRRSLLNSVLSFLLVGVVGGLLWGDGPAVAASTTSTQTILVKGTVSTNAPEVIPFSGKIQIKTTTVTDPDFNLPPITEVSINFLDVQGLGQTTKTKYFALGDNQLNRTLRASDQLGLTFAIATDPNGVTPNGATATVGTGLVSLTLTYDAAGNLTAASGSVSDSPFAPNL